MQNLTKLAQLVLVISALSLSSAGPASAQDWRGLVHDVLGGDQYGDQYGDRYRDQSNHMGSVMQLDRQADSLRDRVRAAYDNGNIGRPDFFRLNRQVSDVIAQIRLMRNGQADSDFGARNMVQRRLSNLESRLDNSIAGRPNRWY